MPADLRNPKHQAILALVDSIPKGSVATYGQVAKEAGQPRSPRLVGKLLSELPSQSELPWHRVVNHRGAISERPGPSPKIQRKRLRAEGVKFRANGCVDLKLFAWAPD